MGLPDVYVVREVRRTRRSRTWNMFSYSAALVCVGRWWLQNKGWFEWLTYNNHSQLTMSINCWTIVLELQEASLYFHTPWTFGLCTYDVFPSRISMDIECVRRSNHSHMELAVSNMHFRTDRSQSLRDVCTISSNWRSNCFRFIGSNSTRMGYRRYCESWRNER